MKNKNYFAVAPSSRPLNLESLMNHKYSDYENLKKYIPRESIRCLGQAIHLNAMIIIKNHCS